MTPAKARRTICTAAMIFTGGLMVWAMKWITEMPADQLSNLDGFLTSGMFASIAAIFKFALDQFDGKIDA